MSSSIVASAVYNPAFSSGVYNPPQYVYLNNAHLMPVSVKFVPLTIPHEWMKFVIGTNGYYFNAITHASKVCYIWYHEHIAMIEIRGPWYNLDEAERRLLQRMNHIKFQVTKRSTMETSTSWPPLPTSSSTTTTTKPKKVMWADMVDDEN